MSLIEQLDAARVVSDLDQVCAEELGDIWDQLGWTVADLRSLEPGRADTFIADMRAVQGALHRLADRAITQARQIEGAIQTGLPRH